MKRIRDLPDLLFRLICLCFTALFLVFGLLTEIGTNAANDRAAALKKEIQSLRADNEILRVQCDNRLDLDELERRAEELGLVRCGPDQICYMELP